MYLIMIASGGALGALARYGVDRIGVEYTDSTLVGTFVVNVSGSFFIGLLTGILSLYPGWPNEIRLFLVVGFLGSYTTFSTFSVASVQLLQSGEFTQSLINVVGNVSLCLLSALAGIMLVRAIDWAVK
ncbi:MAG: fluoride efflux transporter CrcB [Chloroflexota bacterium]|jgi:CrcB protein|nr:fluoride efflux transporter CrcB [Anaerolineales bacterium]MEE2885147.1 fluoride efflux transporter CrcB [Chloroflexota bacterium]